MRQGFAFAIAFGVASSVGAACGGEREVAPSGEWSSAPGDTSVSEVPEYVIFDDDDGTFDGGVPGDLPQITTTQPVTTAKSDSGISQPDSDTSEPDAGPANPVTTTSTTVPAPSTTAVRLRPERPVFPVWDLGPPPSWPFHGVVQLWPEVDYVRDDDGEGPWRVVVSWWLRYWSWEATSHERGHYPVVELPGLRVECLGGVALAVDEHSVEVGGAPGATNITMRVPWGQLAREEPEPSERLLNEAASRPSNVAVVTEGDWVHVGSGGKQRSYAMRHPARASGAFWEAQARHDGELFMLTVHPAHLPCYSGVTWLSIAETGEFVMCGANSAATAFIAPPSAQLAELVLPDPNQTGDYLSCAAQLDLHHIPLTEDRQLVPH